MRPEGKRIFRAAAKRALAEGWAPVGAGVWLHPSGWEIQRYQHEWRSDPDGEGRRLSCPMYMVLRPTQAPGVCYSRKRTLDEALEVARSLSYRDPGP